ncbi:Protein phosphatase 2C [Spironucleus salmonicida]|uniref:protein-serine/threonine phosphatase n=1 Tax=Spironucleus salmonicida TaxID=348837 RepID=V6LNA5_9EUKA|nr:Protein phosphatase 2C [Spironucleus salmonicida]|eukprot:EST45191.1 Protein phosphatase 2C [Spironucleus salmonicida]
MEIKFYNESEFEQQAKRTEQLYKKLHEVYGRKKLQVERSEQIKNKLQCELDTINKQISIQPQQSLEDLQMSVGHHTAIGRRNSNEDSHVITNKILVILDGHGGSETASIGASMILQYVEYYETGNVITDLKLGILNLDHDLPDICSESGATLAFIIKKNSKFYLCNAGDARVLTQNNTTCDHKPTDPFEKDRIERYGGIVMNGRVNAQLAVSRAIGDKAMKIYGVCGLIDIIEIDELSTDWILIACDGLFDVMDNEDVREAIECLLQNINTSTRRNSQIVIDFFYKKIDMTDIAKMSCNYKEQLQFEHTVAQAFVCAAYLLKSSDNISVIFAVKK